MKEKKMATLTSKKVENIDVKELKKIAEKHNKINQLFESNKPIDPSYSKDFVFFPLSDNEQGS